MNRPLRFVLLLFLHILQMSGSYLGAESGYPFLNACSLSESSEASTGRVQDIVTQAIYSTSFINHNSVITVLFF